MSQAQWNQRYLDRDTPWDKGSEAPSLHELSAQSDFARWRGDGVAIVPGCGLGHDVRFLATCSPDLPVVGVDFSSEAIAAARAIEAAGRERYEVADWFAYAPEQAPVSLVWEHTCYCAIDPGERDAYARSLRRILPVGGHFFGVFFTALENDEGPPWPLTLAELKARFESGFELVYQASPECAYPGREGQEMLLGWKRL